MEKQINDQKDELSEPKDSLPPVTIDELPGFMQAAISRAGWTEPTPVQAMAILYI